MHILLNNTGQGDYVPEAKLFVRTTKDIFCAGFSRTQFKKLPIATTIGIFLIAIFWNNSVAAEDGVSRSISLKVIITGRSLNFHKQFKIKFGSYLQTTKERNNTIVTEHALGAIAISPSDKIQGIHTFMNLNMGQYIFCTSWTPLPMPRHIINSVHQLAKTQTRGL